MVLGVVLLIGPRVGGALGWAVHSIRRLHNEDDVFYRKQPPRRSGLVKVLKVLKPRGVEE